MRKLVLLVDDSLVVQNHNESSLGREGYETKTVYTLADAEDFLSKRMPDAIVLDVGMPDGNGLDFLRKLRKNARFVKIPVLVLSGYAKSDDVVAAFTAGADDFLAKPYVHSVLSARLRYLFRNAERIPETLTRGSLTLNFVSHKAFVNDKELFLTPKDFSLMYLFIKNEGELMSTEQIYENVWGQPMGEDSRAIGRAILRLRKKLIGSGYTITTEYRNGYRFEKDFSEDFEKK